MSQPDYAKETSIPRSGKRTLSRRKSDSDKYDLKIKSIRVSVFHFSQTF